MTSKQYEELCRIFIADQFGVEIDVVTSEFIQSPTLSINPDLRHQIDLYWESGNNAVKYVNIANAKWRSGTNKVNQPDVLLLKEVKQQINAHKAVMITNSEFTAGAIAVAKSAGIALHVVQPQFDYSNLAKKNARLILKEMQQVAASSTKPLYNVHIEQRTLNTNPQVSPAIQQAVRTRHYETRISTGGETCVVTNNPGSTSGKNRSFNPPVRGGNPFETR